MESSLSTFISHDQEDETLARLLKAFIEGIFLNTSVFVSSVDLVGGDVWIEELRQKLVAAWTIIVLVTPHTCGSRWILFEAGAGFCERKTIPLLADCATFESIEPPLKLLHGRYYSEEGLKQLMADVAKASRLRVPERFPGLDNILGKAEEFLMARRQAVQPSVDTKPAKVSDLGRLLRQATLDPELRKAFLTLQNRARELLVRSIERARPAFDLPSVEELHAMQLPDLVEVAGAVNAPHPRLIGLNLGHDSLIPAIEDSVWKKMNAKTRLEGLRKELDDYELALNAQGGKLAP